MSDKNWKVRRPTVNDFNNAQAIYNTSFYNAIKSKALVRAKMNDFLKEQDLWNEETEMKVKTLKAEVREAERTLELGGVKLSEAKEIAIRLIKARAELRQLYAVQTELEGLTAEGQAENAKFNYLVSVCVMKPDDTPYFSSLDDYLNRSTETDSLESATKLATMIHGIDEDFEAKLPEYKFLREYNFIDDKYRLLNKEGKFVNVDGHLVDENGNLIDKDGNLVDKDGKKLDNKHKPFLDDSGAPIVKVEAKVEEKVVEPIVDGHVEELQVPKP